MKKIIGAALLLFMLFLVGCSEEKNLMQKELDHTLNDIQKYEKEISEYESQLKDLEKKEQTLFEKTVDLHIEDREQIENNIGRLDASLEERQQIIEEEKAVVEDAEQATTNFDELPSAETDEGNEIVEKLKNALKKRYLMHYDVISVYEELLGKQEDVYNLLIDENVKRVELEEGTIAVNEQRVKLEEAVTAFNQSTDEVNSALKETQQEVID